MSPEELEPIVERLCEMGQADLPHGADEQQITKFEREHGVSLPEGFRAWLLKADGGELFLPVGIQLYGVGSKPFIDVDDNDRPSDDYIVIGALASGDPILCAKKGEQISIFNHDAGIIEDDEVYPDFVSFLNGLPEILGIEE